MINGGYELVQINDVMQIDPAHDGMFGGCFMIVTEVKKWGVQGYVQIPGKGQAYYRCAWENCYLIGNAQWIVKRDDEDAMDESQR
jgi:hypothetical protein